MDYNPFVISWFRMGKSMPALAHHWIKEGFLPEASWLGAKQALDHYLQWKEEQERLKEDERIRFFLESRERIRKEKFLAELRTKKIRSYSTDAVERIGWRSPIEVLPDRKDLSDVMPELVDDPYYRSSAA